MYSINPNTAGALLNIQHFSGPSTFTANDVVNIYSANGGTWFLRVDFSGSNLVYYASGDGQNWVQVASIAKTTQFTTAPDEWGFAAFNNTATAPAIAAGALISWKEQ
jgi:hypothetical protein